MGELLCPEIFLWNRVKREAPSLRDHEELRREMERDKRLDNPLGKYDVEKGRP